MKRRNISIIACLIAGFLFTASPVSAAEKGKEDATKGKGKSSTTIAPTKPKSPPAAPTKATTTVKPTKVTTTVKPTKATTTVKPTKPMTTVKPTKPTTQTKPTKPTPPPKDKFKQQKEYEDNHKNRVSQIDKKYDSDIAKKRKEIGDLQQATSASGKGKRDEAQKTVDKLNQDIDKLNKEKKQKIDDSRDTMNRQKNALWK